MVTASRKGAVIQGTREEEEVVTMTLHCLLVVGAATEALTTLLTETLMTLLAPGA